MEVIVIGAGLGGLAAAISCAQNGLSVQVLERAPEFLPIGAGIQIPPNGVRALKYLKLEEKIQETGAVALNAINLRDYPDGTLLLRRPGGEAVTKDYGSPWLVIHRADYHSVLLEGARRLGVQVRLGCDVARVEFTPGRPRVCTKSGDILETDVVVGADGLWSTTRSLLLEGASPPTPTGDMAYRATFTAEQLQSLEDERLKKLLDQPEVNLWMGPNAHAVLYPLKGGKVYNLVLLCPDTLPPGFNTIEGDVEEMKAAFRGWDPTLTVILGLITKVLKWRLCHHDELVRWVKGNVVIIGDASHPTLPYQAQGAAMAVEDGAVLGHLLGKIKNEFWRSEASAKEPINAVLELFEHVRKHRTTINVQGAVDNRRLFHMVEGPDRDRRSHVMQMTDWKTQTLTDFSWNDLEYQSAMLGFDVIADADRAFEAMGEHNLAPGDEFSKL